MKTVFEKIHYLIHFLSGKFMCVNCGKQLTTSMNFPTPTMGGRCPSNPSGNHVWTKVG